MFGLDEFGTIAVLVMLVIFIIGWKQSAPKKEEGGGGNKKGGGEQHESHQPSTGSSFFKSPAFIVGVVALLIILIILGMEGAAQHESWRKDPAPEFVANGAKPVLFQVKAKYGGGSYTIRTNGDKEDMLRAHPECEIQGYPDCPPATVTQSPTVTPNAMQTTAASAKQTEAALHAFASVTAVSLKYNPPTQTPIPSITPRPTNTAIPSNTPIPTNTRVPPTDTPAPTSTPSKPCIGKYIASDNTEHKYSLPVGQTLTDLDVLADGTKIQVSCINGVFYHQEIPPVVRDIEEKAKQGGRLLPYVSGGFLVLIAAVFTGIMVYWLRRKVANPIEAFVYMNVFGIAAGYFVDWTLAGIFFGVSLPLAGIVWLHEMGATKAHKVVSKKVGSALDKIK